MARTPILIIATITLVGVASLTAAPCSVTSPFLTCGAIISVQPIDFTLEVSDPVDSATLDASDFTVNGIPADSFTLSNNNTFIDFIFNYTPAIPGINTMHIPAGAFNWRRACARIQWYVRRYDYSTKALSYASSALHAA